MKKWIILMSLWATILLSKSLGAQEIYFVFDIDDNTFFLPTKIMLQPNHKGEKEIGVTTAEYALIRESIGKSGKYKNYTVNDSSFRFFADDPQMKRNFFIEDLKKALETDHWKGPSWDALKKALSHPETAKNVFFITARRHSPIAIRNAFEFLKEKKEIQNLPPTKQIWTVGSPVFSKQFKKTFKKDAPSGDSASSSIRKAAVQIEILHLLNEKKFSKKAVEVLSPDGKSNGLYHLWGFSDDDYGNFETTLNVLQKELHAGAWPHIKITLFFTGKNHPTEKPKAIVLSKSNPPRPVTDVEQSEWECVMSEKYFPKDLKKLGTKCRSSKKK